MNKEGLLNKFPGQINLNNNLSHLTWFKVGGPAEILFKPDSEKSLIEFINVAHEIWPFTVLGAGSNVLVRDGGIKGVVIKLGRPFNNIEFNANAKTLIVGASCLNINLANFAAKNSISGLEFLCGIPGTIGGGVAMNAGAYGREFKDIIKNVHAVNSRGQSVILTNQDLNFKYRSHGLDEEMIFIKAEICINAGDANQIKNKMQQIMEQRKGTQPINSKTAGSIFANPTGYKSWQLIDEAGMRGMRIGDAQISPLHSNFMININHSTSKDLEDLGMLVQKRVKECFNIELDWEIRRLGYYE